MTDKFWEKVDMSGDCWLWKAAKTKAGYGQFAIQRKPFYAHRLAYEGFVGLIPDGLELDHLCRNRACVNPAHLEPVSHRENCRRGIRASATHCPQKHPYDSENTFLRVRPDGRQSRECRTCHRERELARKQRLRAEKVLKP